MSPSSQTRPEATQKFTMQFNETAQKQNCFLVLFFCNGVVSQEHTDDRVLLSVWDGKGNVNGKGSFSGPDG